MHTKMMLTVMEENVNKNEFQIIIIFNVSIVRMYVSRALILVIWPSESLSDQLS